MPRNSPAIEEEPLDGPPPGEIEEPLSGPPPDEIEEPLSLSEDAEAVCPNWCGTHTQTWRNKCQWADMVVCQPCSSCQDNGSPPAITEGELPPMPRNSPAIEEEPLNGPPPGEIEEPLSGPPPDEIEEPLS